MKTSTRQEGRVILQTPIGILRGRHQAVKSGLGYYYSFKGIRYGQPPIGQRRFRSALPEQPWNGVRNALREGATCPHRNMLLDTYGGSEDCLFLNVFTPILPSENRHPKLPVMVFIHGGAFTFGSGNTFLYGPDYIVQEGVILVTINYRLGPIGFLSVGGDAPGNAGLKDQVLALKWVRDNIAAFGGNPNDVTIFGQSAGGASVHYLMLSPMASGLFHRAICQSGTALNTWARAPHARERAFALGKVLGLETNDTSKLLEHLRTVSPKMLIDAAPLTLTPEDARSNIGLPFVPVIEDSWADSQWEGTMDAFKEGHFLAEEPLELIKKKNYNNVPLLLGYNTHEAMLFIRRLRKDPSLIKAIESDFERLIPSDLQIPGGKSSEAVVSVGKDVRDFYLGSRAVSNDTLEEMIYLLTDTMFAHGIVETARQHAANGRSKVYLYRFEFDGALGLYKRLLGIARPGTCHGDELGYLFHFGLLNLSLNPHSIETQVKYRMVKMWTNFAKFGNPTPYGKDDDALNGVTWKPVNGTDVMNVPFLNINAKNEMKLNPDPDRLKFWDNLYMKYNGNTLSNTV
uniref:Carboxylic ester hydrolase n=3 Tax=Culicoides sonorensis TaxID=179676 RepID=A0A336MQG4_CULSO